MAGQPQPSRATTFIHETAMAAATEEERRQIQRREAMRQAVLDHLAREGQDIVESSSESSEEFSDEDEEVPAPCGATASMTSGLFVQPGDVLVFASLKSIGDIAKLRFMNGAAHAIAVSIQTAESRAYTADPSRLTLRPNDCVDVEVRSNGARRIAKRPPLMVRALLLNSADAIADAAVWADINSGRAEELQIRAVRHDDVKQLREQKRISRATRTSRQTSANNSARGRLTSNLSCKSGVSRTSKLSIRRSQEDDEDEDISFEEYQRRNLLQIKSK